MIQVVEYKEDKWIYVLGKGQEIEKYIAEDLCVKVRHTHPTWVRGSFRNSQKDYASPWYLGTSRKVTRQGGKSGGETHPASPERIS